MKQFIAITIALLVFPFLMEGQTQTENYIKTTTYQVATTNGLVADDDKLEAVTYYDGLGRPIESINARGGGVRENIVSYMEYDSLGMQTKQYLPWASSGQVLPSSSALTFIPTATVSSDIASFYNTPNYDNTTNPYSETVFEKSPLFRTLEQAAPGNDWSVANGHTIKFDYQINAGAIYKFSVGFIGNDYSEPELLNQGTYAAFELSVTQTRDENWEQTDGIYGKTYELTNKSGQVILKRTSVANANLGPQDPNYHDTYYVYDDHGNLTYVIPPEATDIILSGFGIDQAVLDSRGYQYKYDKRNRLIWKKLPGKGFEVIVYDSQDRPILTQDALMRAENPNKYLFTKYDCLDRVAYTGFHISNYSLWADVQADVPNASNCEVMQGSSSVVGDTVMYYSNSAYPTTNLEPLTVNYYDTYVDYSGLIRPSNVYGVNPGFTNTRGLPTVSKVRVLGETNGLGQAYWITALTEYDSKGRAVYTAANNPYLETVDIVKTKLDFTGKPDEITTTHARVGNAMITTIDYFVYDHAGRLITHTQKVDTQPIQRIAENQYDHLGQLVTKEVGGLASTSALEMVDFTYNIRGWLTQINDVSAGGISPKLFNFKINYNSLDGTTNGTALYNGNIAQTLWKTTHNDTDIRGYDYTYDQLNRIKEAKGFKGALLSSMTANNTHDVTDIDYDKNGNILNLARNGSNDLGTSSGVWDDLSYTYSANQLIKVEENSQDANFKDLGFIDGHTGLLDDYEYDVNGNMTIDRNKHIDSITYNHLNLPVVVEVTGSPTATNGVITYVYDATGVKLQKRLVETGGVPKYTQYAGNYIYEYEQIGNAKAELQFFNHPEGYIVPTIDVSGGLGGSVSYSDFDYVFQYKDHLGNVRLSYGDTNTNGTIETSEIIEESNYYPFGLKQKGYNNTVSSNGNALAQQWKFGGKQLSEELGLNTYDFGARNYDAALGRWFVVDALAEAEGQIFNSPYAYGMNNPVFYNDPDGNCPPGIDCTKLLKTIKNFTFNNTGKGKPTLTFGLHFIKPDFAERNTEGGAGAFVENTAKALYNSAVSTWNGAMNGEDYGMMIGDGMEAMGETADRVIEGEATVQDAENLVAGGLMMAVRGKAGGGKGKISKAGVTGHTKHGLNQSINRDGGRGVSASAKADAIANPKSVTSQSGGRTKFKGKKATVVTNSDGKIITTFGKSRSSSSTPQGRPQGGGKAQRRNIERTGASYNPNQTN